MKDLFLGKQKCYYLKKYRSLIARKYGLNGYYFKPCLFGKNCVGSCEKCDIELRLLNDSVSSLGEKRVKLPKEKGIDIRTPINIAEHLKDKGLYGSLKESDDYHTVYGLFADSERRDKEPLARIFGIERLCINIDGPGITTLIGLSGCLMDCRYCINKMNVDKHFRDEYLVSCETLYDIVKQDNLYFMTSNGGICFGGGEPLLQIDFILAFIKYLRANGVKWQVGLETSMNIFYDESIEELLGLVDFLIVDVKSLDNAIYEKYTSWPITYLLKNLEKLLHYKGHLRLRVPYIEGYQDKDKQNWVVSELLKMGFSEHQIECFDYVKVEDYSMSDMIDGDISEIDALEGDVPLDNPFEYPYIGIEELLDEIVDISEIKGIREIIADDTELSPESKLDLLNKIDSKIKAYA